MHRTQLIMWAILVAEAGAVAIFQHPWTSPDSHLYLELAQNLSGPGFVSAGAPNDIRVPAYPWFLNLIIFRLGLNTAVVVAVQMGLYLTSVWLIAHKVITDGRMRLLFLGLAIVYIFPFFYSAMILSEALSIFLVAASITLLVRAERLSSWALGGLALGICGLVRTDLLTALGAVVLIGIYRRKFLSGAVAIAVAFVVLLPYMVWNFQTFGRFSPMPVASTIGQSLYLASWESRLTGRDLDMMNYGRPITPDALSSGYAGEVLAIQKGRTGRELSDAFQEVAVARLKADPLDTVWHSVRGVWRLNNTADYPAPWWAGLVLHAVSNIVWLLGMVGAALALKSRKITLVPLAFAAAILIPHLPLHTEARYTASIRLVLMFYAAFAVMQLVARFSRDWHRRYPECGREQQRGRQTRSPRSQPYGKQSNEQPRGNKAKRKRKCG